jgi:glyoxylase-like metal-dependent hydrolase (beta-lactamase superfamily II)
MHPWQHLGNDVYLYRDSCNGFAVRGADGQWLVINAGTGRAAPGLRELGPVNGTTVLLTHHFRGHTAGAGAFQSQGALVFAPYWERDHLGGLQPAFRSRESRLLYDLAWDNFAPIEPVAVDRWLMDYERVALAGLSVEVIPAPGVSMGAVAYAVELPGGRKIAFVGELMCGPGRLARLSPLQYNYNDLLGGENVLLSWDRVLAAAPAAIFPSLGQPFEDPGAAVAQLRENLRRFESIQPGYAARIDNPPPDDVEEVAPRLYRARNTEAETHFIIGRSGWVLALDYGQ